LEFEEELIKVHPLKHGPITEPDIQSIVKKNAVLARATEQLEKFRHTATSNRLTCLCETRANYRLAHDIPFGGFKK